MRERGAAENCRMNLMMGDDILERYVKKEANWTEGNGCWKRNARFLVTVTAFISSEPDSIQIGHSPGRKSSPFNS